jgi:DNA repair protein RadD
MRHPLRDYQEKATSIAVSAFLKEKNPFILVLATGAGKSHVIAEICHRVNDKVLILCPSKEILEQNKAKMHAYGYTDITAYSASVGEKKLGRYTFATIGSVYKTPELFMDYNYVIIDECHGVDPKNQTGMLTSFLREIHCEHVLGLTATPYRITQLYTRDQWGNLKATASLRMINRIGRTPFFKKILYKIETGELIARGFLAPIDYYIDNVDLSELVVNTTGADFTTASMDRYWKSKRRLLRIIQAVEYSHQKNKRTLIFCSSIKQATTVQKNLLERGLDVPMVTGKTPLKDRETIINNFRSGKIKHLLNVGVFTTGFDVPELDCIVMARPTMSLALYYQIIGRGVRLDPTAPNKRLQVYDLVGVVERLGRIETIKVQTEKGGFRDEVWSEVGRMDNKELYSFRITPKEKNNGGRKSPHQRTKR